MAHNAVSIVRRGLHERARRAQSIGTAMPGPAPIRHLTPSRIGSFVYCPEADRINAEGYSPDTEAKRAGTAHHDWLARRIEAGNNSVALRVLLALLAVAGLVVALVASGWL